MFKQFGPIYSAKQRLRRTPLWWVQMGASLLLLSLLVLGSVSPVEAEPASAAGTTPSLIATVPVDSSPIGVAVNPKTNRAYVSNNSGNNVSVIDLTTNQNIATVDLGRFPTSIAVNPVTNKIYVSANIGLENITSVMVIDGATNKVTATIPLERGYAQALMVNPATNHIYVVSPTADFVSIIDGASDTVVDKFPLGTTSFVLDINFSTNRLYIADPQDNLVVFDLTSKAKLATVPAGYIISDLKINPVTNKIYVLSFSGSLTVVDGATNKVLNTIKTGSIGSPEGLAVNSKLNRIYIAIDTVYTNNLAVVNGATDQLEVTLTLPGSPRAVAINPATDRIYVTDGFNQKLWVLEERAGSPVVTCFRPSRSQLTEYRMAGESGKAGEADPQNSLDNLLDGQEWTYWRWLNYPKSVAVEVDLGRPQTLTAFKLFTQVPGKADTLYFQYQVEGTNSWSDIPNLGNITNASAATGSKTYDVPNVVARRFRFVVENPNYLYDIGYFGDFQLCTSSQENPPTRAYSAGPHLLPIVGAKASGGNPANLLDGLPWTDWVVSGPDQKQATLTLDLGQHRYLSAIKYFATFSGVARSTRVEISDDPNFPPDKTTVLADNVNTGSYGNGGPAYGLNTLSFFSRYSAGQYLRFTITNPNNDWSLGGYGDIQIYGS